MVGPHARVLARQARVRTEREGLRASESRVQALTANGAGLGRGAAEAAAGPDTSFARDAGLETAGLEAGLTGRLEPLSEALLEALLAEDETRLPPLVAEALARVMPDAAQDAGQEAERRQSPVPVPRDVLEAVLIALDWYWVSHCAARAGVQTRVINGFERAIRREVEVFLITVFGESVLRQIAEVYDLRRKNLGSLSAAEEELVAEYCRRLGRALAVRKGYRHRPSGVSGRVDLRRTARQAAARGGVPVALCRRRRAPAFPQLVILADVSGSVRRFSRFFLEVCWSLRERFARTEVFFFVDRLARATDVLATDSVAGALEWALTAAPVSLTNNSDYGSVFAQFVSENLPELFNPARDTTVVVLGDARNNWRPSGVEFLAEIAAASRAILWLNPLPRVEWESRDAIMREYLPFCRRAWSLGSVADLEKVAAEIVREPIFGVREA